MSILDAPSAEQVTYLVQYQCRYRGISGRTHLTWTMGGAGMPWQTLEEARAYVKERRKQSPGPKGSTTGKHRILQVTTKVVR